MFLFCLVPMNIMISWMGESMDELDRRTERMDRIGYDRIGEGNVITHGDFDKKKK